MFQTHVDASEYVLKVVVTVDGVVEVLSDLVLFKLALGGSKDNVCHIGNITFKL